MRKTKLSKFEIERNYVKELTKVISIHDLNTGKWAEYKEALEESIKEMKVNVKDCEKDVEIFERVIIRFDKLAKQHRA